MDFDFNSLPIGALAMIVFLSRVVDVSVGTVRAIATVQGRLALAFVLGLFEVTIWLIVITAVVSTVMERPWLLAFYALGFSTGNVIGIVLEQKLALGHAILRIITGLHAREVTEALRQAGFRVTQFAGEGVTGPVTELQVVCERRQLERALRIVRSIDPEIFYLCEAPTRVRRYPGRYALPTTMWLGAFKRK